MIMPEFDNSLRRQTFSLPGLLTELFEPLREQSKELAEKYFAAGIRKVIFIGCGDSNAAAMTMRFHYCELTGTAAEVISVIDFSRNYPVELLAPDVLVVCVSVSGSGARIEEAVSGAKRAGARTLAVTRDKESGIGRLADDSLVMPVSSFERGPGNRNYFASVLALLLFAVESGRRSGRLTDVRADACEDVILEQGKVLETSLSDMDRQLADISGRWKDYVNFDFVGAGDDFVNAWFGHAKIIEAVGAFATHNNSEEWFHMNNFFRNIGQCGTIFFATRGSAGISRTREAVSYAAKIGRPVMVVTDEAPGYFGTAAEYIRVPPASWLPAALLTHYLPSCLLAGYIGAMWGERNCRGCLGPWEFAAGGEYIRNSEIIVKRGDR